MARIATTIKETFANQFQELTERQRNEYVGNSLILYSECLQSLIEYATKKELTEDNLITLEEVIRENIVIESLYANPDDPQKVVSIARTKICKAVKIMLDNGSDPDEIYSFIIQNSGTVALKAETEDLLKYYRFVTRYHHVGLSPEYENE